MSPIPFWAWLYVDQARRPLGFSTTMLVDLEQYLEQFGASSIRKIIVSFLPRPGLRHLFPYGIHNLVLHRSSLYPLLFRIQFYHYVNPQNVCVELPHEYQRADYFALAAFIYRSPILTAELAARILYPFLTPT